MDSQVDVKSQEFALQLRALKSLSDLIQTIESIEDLGAQMRLSRQVTSLVRMVGAFVDAGVRDELLPAFVEGVEAENARRAAPANRGRRSKSERTQEIVKRHEAEFRKARGHNRSTPNHIAESILGDVNVELRACELPALGVDAIATRIRKTDD
jgi:hypothetical protein